MAVLPSGAYASFHGRPQDFFPGVGKLGGVEKKVPQRSPEVESDKNCDNNA